MTAGLRMEVGEEMRSTSDQAGAKRPTGIRRPKTWHEAWCRHRQLCQLLPPLRAIIRSNQAATYIGATGPKSIDKLTSLHRVG